MIKEVHYSLQKYVNAVLTYKKELIWDCQKHECMLFRGQCDKEYELLPSIARGQRFATSGSLMEEERNLIESAKFRLPDVFNRSYEPIELLALLQHYGIPTRLLDVTENALVALFFACSEHQEKDAEVIIFRHDEKDIADYPIVNAIAESYKFLKGTISAFGPFLNNVIYQNYFREQYSFPRFTGIPQRRRRVRSIGPSHGEILSTVLLCFSPKSQHKANAAKRKIHSVFQC